MVLEDKPETPVDLRSDTVTKPTEAMRAAIASAEVGDDGRGDDMTVKALEQYAAQVFGKEAALFVPSGTMGNLICVLVHCSERGSEVILGDKCHICLYEQGGLATIGVSPSLSSSSLIAKLTRSFFFFFCRWRSPPAAPQRL